MKLSALADEIAKLDPSDDPRTLLRLDVRVHTAIYKASGNPYLEDVLVCQDAHATRIWCLFLDRLSNVAEHVTEHVAAAAGDHRRGCRPRGQAGLRTRRRI